MKNPHIGRWLRGHAFAVVAVLGLAGGRAPAEEFTFNWTDTNGVEHAARGVIELPAGWADQSPDERVGVVLFGGGLSHDADWTVPGWIDHLGEPMQLTRDGEDTHDGRTLAHALRDAGLGAVRFELGVRQNAEAASLATVGFADTLACARAAWDAALLELALPAERVIVLGHSLGATRGVLVSEGHARGYALLAGAYMSYEAGSPTKLRDEAIGSLGYGLDWATIFVVSREDLERDVNSERAKPRGKVDQQAARDARQLALDSFDAIDADASGTLSGSELAAWRSPRERPRELFRPDDGTPWAIDVLIEGARPTLALWGGRDVTSMHGPVLADVAQRAGAPVECRYFPEMGHQLDALAPGEQEYFELSNPPTLRGHAGPMNPGVVAMVVEWCAGQ
ncbi:MAG: hypothetical protein RBS39_01850 [Phycisphaerales bacterium]|jgi:pimeloyl-ACP methyl ester carboxylesterase|nr:hypothetical protein [Phycisphaerales bacterium]